MRSVLIVAFFLLSAWPRGAFGQDGDDFTPPSGYVTMDVNRCRFVLPERNSAVVDQLMPSCQEALERMFAQVGADDGEETSLVQIRIVSEPEQMSLVTPGGSVPPQWSSALAFPDVDVIVLPLVRRDGMPIDDLDVVLEHELSHLALRKALKGAQVPRWFSEGIAIHQSEGSSFGRFWTLWTAKLQGRLLPLDKIDQNYPERVSDVSLAYAEAADFVSFLIRKGGWLGIRVVIRNSASGASFDEAIEISFKQGTDDLEREWKRGLETKWPWLHLITGTGAVWGLMVVLFLIAYVAAKKRGSRRMAEMKEEDEMVEDMIRQAEARRRRESEFSALPSVRTKVRIEDDIHTLH